MYCKYLNEEGENDRKELEKTTPKGTHDHVLHSVIRLIVPLPEALERLPLPLSWEIVTADVSLAGNLGAWGSGRGGGWCCDRSERAPCAASEPLRSAAPRLRRIGLQLKNALDRGSLRYQGIGIKLNVALDRDWNLYRLPSPLPESLLTLGLRIEPMQDSQILAGCNPLHARHGVHRAAHPGA